MLALSENCRSHIPTIPATPCKKIIRKYPRTKQRGPYRSYSINEKQNVVDLHLQGKNFATISKELDIPQKNVVRWCREYSIGKPFTNRSASHSVKDGLSSWLQEYCSESFISFSDVEKKAMELSSGTSLRPSKSWLRRFVKEDSKREMLIDEEE